MDFGCLSATRRADHLIFRPLYRPFTAPLPPWAERCASMQVLSIAVLLVTVPDVASALPCASG